MKIWKTAVLFYLGGMLYTALELLWRGRSHGSMFVLGGLCFVLVGRLGQTHLSEPVVVLLGAALVTACELGTGLLVNRTWQIWDYRGMILNFRGQICLGFSLLWMPLCLVAAGLYRVLWRALPDRRS